MSTLRPIRILHVVGGMNYGGIETWLINVLRHIDRNRFHMDFLVHMDQPCAHGDEIRALGSHLIPCSHPNLPWRYAAEFLSNIDRYGPYDIVHTHVHAFSGFALILSRLAGVAVRIAHSHNDRSPAAHGASFYRWTYLTLMKKWIRGNATSGLAASTLAAKDLFGNHWELDARYRILLYGIDLAPFSRHAAGLRETMRVQFGLPANAFVIGHVGRLVIQKNHTFLIEVFAEVVRRNPQAYLLLVGDGPLELAIKSKVHSLGLTDHVIFAGMRSDVPQVMASMDVFVFPSLYEGLGIALIEAQAAGLTCILSDIVPREADVVLPLMHRLSLRDSPVVWSNAILASAGGASLSQQEALAMVKKSAFNIENSVTQLESIYAAIDHG